MKHILPNHPTLRVVLYQLLGNAALALLFIAWLQIPDSHVWEFALAVLSIIALAAAFLALHTITLQTLRNPLTATVPETVATSRLWLGAAILAVWIILWHILLHVLTPHLDPDIASTRAGYWNSQLSPHLRTVFTFARLTTWQQDAAQLLVWWIIPTLLLPLIMESVARALRTLRERPTWRIYRRWQLWLTTAIAAWLALWATDKLVAWHPAHTIHGEIISVALRFAAIYVLAVLLYCAVLAIIATLLHREHTKP